MKPTKVRNQQIYRATNQVASSQVSSSLSKDLRKKYGKRSVRAVEGDTIKVIRGEYKGVEGKITKVATDKRSVAIEGIKKEKLKGGKIDVYIQSSNLIITNLNTDDKWRKNKLENKPKGTVSVSTDIQDKKTEKKEVSE